MPGGGMPNMGGDHSDGPTVEEASFLDCYHSDHLLTSSQVD